MQLRKFICFIWHNSLKKNCYCCSLTYIYFHGACKWAFNEWLHHLSKQKVMLADLFLSSKFWKGKYWKYLRNFPSLYGNAQPYKSGAKPQEKSDLSGPYKEHWQIMMEQLLVTWYNTICCPSANVQVDFISGFRKEGANQLEKAVFDYPSQSPKENRNFFLVSIIILVKRIMVLFLTMKSASEFKNNTNANGFFFSSGLFLMAIERSSLKNVCPIFFNTFHLVFWGIMYASHYYGLWWTFKVLISHSLKSTSDSGVK